MAATAALIKYVEKIQDIFFAQGTLNIVYQSTEKSCLIGNSFCLP